MTDLVHALGTVLAVLRPTLFGLAVLLTVVCALDWAVRTRRINPFSPVARFFRRSVDPLIAPIERRVVRAGGLPSSAPWYALAAVVLGGILLITLLGFLQQQVAGAAFAASAGTRGVIRLLVSWTFGLLQIALLVYVVSGWIRISPYSPWVRWAHVLSEPLLRPLRRVIPPIGGAIDVTPLVAYFALALVGSAIVRAI